MTILSPQTEIYSDLICAANTNWASNWAKRLTRRMGFYLDPQSGVKREWMNVAEQLIILDQVLSEEEV